MKTITVPFHGTELYVVNYNNEPYTPMKPIINGMGMDWASQFTKLKQRFSKGIAEITIPSAGGEQRMVCLALRKLSAWLNTISPNKVRPEIRDRVIQYQTECDDVLYEYWATGEVKRKSTSTDERTSLRDAINMLVGKKSLMYPEAYSLIHQRFNVNHIDELEASQLPQAVEYVHRLVLDGEFIGKEMPPVANERLLLTLKNGNITLSQVLREDQHVATMAEFFDLAKRADYLVVHKDDLMALMHA
ncbi:phage antirepressor N-terminal domain-containing protein [Erwinia tracheiphila]|uniref:Antirepressor n=1 Tax=Erwinia tracheiphila TaxID=65700 RepID=A0A0M2KAN0_9GAMM|nr:phage antirepressor N-terminal domain-containing protein [Erwinia tracheiphila]EOS94813.1 phage antirepressor protein [Erwinia tracheiphila PSU-1]KKF35979.1 antirepressor [Erwinia tracheiphila]UIA87296.1 phage antirepressor N-terminal domain-containing protein [Erwinia tracheiphila]UIA95659.1 phage antirepressor N-terminal domain-containing protein [Erwinia tracheiphila]